MKILVLGGTGAIGIHTVQYLIDNGNEVYVTSRLPRKSLGNCHYLLGNARNNDYLYSLLNTMWDCIIDFMNYDTYEFKNRVSRLLDSTEQYIFISSSRVYSDLDEIITEKTPRLLDVSGDLEYLATDEYALHKARQENILLTSNKRNWTIVRPYITYNDNRLQLGVLELPNWLYRALQGRTIVFSKDIASKYTTLTYGKDVANGIASLVGHQECLSQIFHITTEQSILWGDVLEIYLNKLEHYLGKRPAVKWSKQSLNLLIPEAKYQVLYDRCYNRRFCSAKIGEFVDVSGFTSPYVGLEQCLGNFLDNPKMGYSSTTIEALEDKYCGEKSSLTNYTSLRTKAAYMYKRYIKPYQFENIK